MRTRAVVFDAYGTLLDMHAVSERYGAEFSRVWRQRQLEYTWLRALMNRYVDFQKITEESLRATAPSMTEGEIRVLLEDYLQVPAFSDVPGALDAMKDLPLAVLSNGTRAMVETALNHNELRHFFAHIISVDEVKTYKPSPRVYALGPERLGEPASEILFVSSNWWDAAGAKEFGYRVCWCNRAGTAFEGTAAPDFIVRSLTELAACV